MNSFGKVNAIMGRMNMDESEDQLSKIGRGAVARRVSTTQQASQDAGEAAASGAPSVVPVAP